MTQPQQLAEALQWRRPWPPGDPAPEIWSIIYELDKVAQLRVVDAVFDAQIAMAKAHIAGLETIRGALASGAKAR